MCFINKSLLLTEHGHIIGQELYRSAVNPAVGQAAKKACDPQGCKTDRRMWPQAAPSVTEADLTSKLALETWTITVAKPDDVGLGAVQEQAVEGESVLEVSGEEIPSMELADQIAVHRSIPVTEPNSLSVNTSSTSISTFMHSNCSVRWRIVRRNLAI